MQNPSGFLHEALIYRGDDDYVGGLLPFLEKSVADDATTMVAVPRARVEMLRDHLGRAADDISWVDMEVLGRNPGRIISAWHQLLKRCEGSGRPVRGVGEPIWAGRSEAEVTESQRHETLLNLAFEDATDFTLVCPYDASVLDVAVIAEAHRSHPQVRTGDEAHGSDSYRGTTLAPFDAPLPEPVGPLESFHFGPNDLAHIRRFVRTYGMVQGMDHAPLLDLVLAVDEIATNSIRYGGGAGELRAWCDGVAITCEVRDGGFIHAPLAGRRLPNAENPTGRGIWLVNHLCDLVQIRSGEHGTVVRVHRALHDADSATLA